MKVGLLPREPLHRNPTSISRAFQQRHRSPEPDCPHRSSLPSTPETASLGPGQSPQRSASSDPSANRVGIIQRESNAQVRFHTASPKKRQSAVARQMAAMGLWVDAEPNEALGRHRLNAPNGLG